jgi:pyridoxamine 5'-phosphate oxidase
MSSELFDEALKRLTDELERASRAGVQEPHATVLATADRQGRPSARVVLIKQVDQDGLVFFSNRESRKGRELEANPRAALVFHWPPTGIQVRVEGTVEHLPEARSDAYFASRPRDSQLGSWASEQSRPLSDYMHLLGRLARMQRRFEGQDVQRPPHWIGYRVVPTRLEFWKAGDYRLHERVLYEKTENGWEKGLLFP